MLSISAFNALLKTLEEPPAHAIFILCTTETHKLPQTIISRCQRFDLKRVSAKELKNRLEKIAKAEGKKIDGPVLDNIIRHSEGCVRDAESLLGKIFTLGETITSEQAEIILPRSDFNKIASFLGFIAENNSTAAIELVNNLIEDGIDMQVFVEDLLEFLRKIMLIKVNGNLSDFGIELDEESQKSAQELAQRFDYRKLMATIDLFMIKRQAIKSALIQQFPLEMAVIELTEEISPAKDYDGDDSEPGSKLEGIDLSRTQRVKEKIKDKLSHLNPIKPRSTEISLANIDLKKEDADGIKIDMISSSGKLGEEKSVNFSKVKENWKEIVVKLLEENYTIASLLRISEPLRCDGNVLEIAVKNNFYYQRIVDRSNRLLIEKIISDVLKLEVKIRPIVKDNVVPLPVEIDYPVAASDESQVLSPVTTVTEPSTVKIKNLEKVSLDKPADAAQDVISMF